MQHECTPDKTRSPNVDHSEMTNVDHTRDQDISSSDALRMVREQWPDTFRISSPHPLKIGIHNEMKQTRLFPLAIIKKALRLFTSQDRYLMAIKPGRNRIGLDGKIAGKVKLQEAVNAEILLYNRHQAREKKHQRIHVGQLRLVSQEPTQKNEPSSSTDNA